MEVDHVYTWVNSSDPELAKLRQHYRKAEVKEDDAYRAGPARVADHGELRESLETAERCVPFVRNTYILGSGSPPEWLATSFPNVIYVPQESVVPAEYWPNFQASVIEAFIHRIPGLAENYIYSNDDFFFAQPLTISHFFTPAGRSRVGLHRTPAATGPNPTYRAVEENNIRALMKHVRLPSFYTGMSGILEHPAPRSRLNLLWLRFKFARRGLRLLNQTTHVTQPFLKSEWPEFLEEFKEELHPLFTRKHRSPYGVNTNTLYQYFVHSRGKSEFYFDRQAYLFSRYLPLKQREHLLQRLFVETPPVTRFCLNDTPAKTDDGWEDFVKDVCDRLRKRDSEAQQA